MQHSIKNVAIIMDGNGRWAQERGRPRVWGHVRGAQTVRSVVTKACEMNLRSLTLYAFSTENWTRPRDEVSTLFKLLKKFLRNERKLILENNIKFRVIGNYSVLDSEIVSLIEDLQDDTKDAAGLMLNLAVNYGGRAEIIDAVNSFLKTNQTKEITEEDFVKHLYNPELNEIDLLIRTAGDIRVSNFLLWQISYAELFFSQLKWPDFSAGEFERIISHTGTRDRRFGSLENYSAEKSMSPQGIKGKLN